MGDLLATPREVRAPDGMENETLSDEVVELLALQTGDGGQTHHGFSFTNQTEEVLRRHGEVVHALGGHTTAHYVSPQGTENLGIRGGGLRALCRAHGLACHARVKRIPPSIFCAPKRQVALYINRLLACDGHVHKKNHAVELAVSSRRLAEDFKFLLLRLGVLSRLAHKRAACTYKGQRKEFDAWRVTIWGAQNLERLLTATGPILGKASACEELLAYARRVRGNSNVDILPLKRKDLAEIWAEDRAAPRGDQYKLRPNNLGYLGREKARLWAEAATYVPSEIERLLAADVFWDPVTLVENRGDLPVFDLSVGSTHTFTGNGIVLHNSWAALLLGSVFDDIDRVIILAPSSTLTNLNRERLRLRPYFKLCPDIVIDSFEKVQRATPDGEPDYIETLVTARNGNPARTLLVFDEAHRLKNITSARGTRVLRLIMGMQSLRVCMLSGSLFDNSIKEAAHLAWMALREHAPIPGEWGKTAAMQHEGKRTLASWANCLDVKGEPDDGDWIEFRPILAKYDLLREFAANIGKKRTAVARRAFQLRLRSCPGTVVSSDSSLQGVTLNIHGFNPEVPEDIEVALEEVAELGTDPDGNELSDDISVWRIQRQLSQGYFYIWDWPLGADGKPLVDADWKLARSTWKKHVRFEIKNNGKTGYDSEKLVYTKVQRDIAQFAVSDLERAWIRFVGRSRKDAHDREEVLAERKAHREWAEAGGSPEAFNYCLQRFLQETSGSPLHRAWVKWSGVHKHKPQPPTKAIWVSEFLVDAVVEWAKRQEADGLPGIIWYDFQEFGNALARRGIPVYGAGTEPPKQACTVALSIGTHSEGKNLFAWSRQLYVSPPAGGKMWQQSLARTFRPGQLATQVDAWVAQHTEPFEDALHKARAAADYVFMLNGMEQNLLLATYTGIAVRRLGSEVFDGDEGTAIAHLDDLDEDLRDAA